MPKPGDRPKRLLTENMKRLRTIRGMSGDALAEKADLSGGYIRQIETSRAWPSSTSLDRIAKALAVPIHELFRPHRR